MRIVHWYPNFLAGGGVANAVLGLADAQAAAGADTWIATLASDEAIYGTLRPADGVQVATWGSGRSVRAGSLRLHLMGRASRRALRALEPDVVHAHAEFNPDNWWAPRLWPCPLVLSPHGAFHATVRQRRARSKGLYLAAARRLLYTRVTRFHALSPAEERDVCAALPSALTYCVPQGPSPALRGAAPADHPRPGGPVRLMFVGRIDVEVKGLDLLLEALARSGRSDATLSLVGPDWGGGTARLRALAQRLGIADRVEFRGRVPADEVAALLRGCDVYVQLSRNESSPLSLNDALALGKPAIVSDRVGTVSSPEIRRLPHVKVVPPDAGAAAQAIADALADLEGLRASARAAQDDVRRFLSWEHAAEAHLQLYASLLSTR